MKLSTILKIVLALVVLVVAGLAVFIATLDVNQYKDRIASTLRDATGREVTLSGDMDLALGLTPALVVEGATIGNPDWASEPNMASIGRLEAQVELLPLLQGTLKVVRLALVDATVALETNADGTGNWAFGEAGDAPTESGQGDGMALDVQEISLENATLTYRDGATGETMKVALAQATATGSGLDAPLGLDIAGAYNDADFTFKGSLGPLAALTGAAAGPWPLDVTATAGGATVSVKGTIAEPTAASGIDLAFAVEGAQLSDLAALAATVGQSVDVPALGPYRVAGSLQGSAEALAISGLDASVGRADALRATATGEIASLLTQSGLNLTVSVDAPDPAAAEALGIALPAPLAAKMGVADIDGGYGLDAIEVSLGNSVLSGAMQVFLAGERPAVLGEMSATLLDLNELAGGDAEAGGGGASSGGDGRLIPDTPLPMDALTLADADLKISADRAILPGGAEITGIDLGVTIAGGALSLNPVAANVAEGTLNGIITLQPTGNGGASLAMDVNGDGVKLGTLARTFGNSDALTGGPSTLRVALTGQGATVRQIAGTLNGAVLLHTTDAVINNGAVNWAGGDVFAQIGDTMNPFSDREPTTPVQCLVFNMTANNGVLSNPYGLAMETDRMAVGGGGAMDLGAERLNLKIAPRPRQGIGLETGLGKIVQLFAVIGSFSNPQLELDAEAALETGLRTAASAAGAVATGGLSLIGESLLGGGDDAEMEPCLVALGQKEPGSGSGGGASGGSGTISDVGAQVKGVAEGAAEAIDGAVGSLLGGGGSDGAQAAPSGSGSGESGGGGIGGAIEEGIGGLFGD
jgi:uncharacterized protein involved in outer membrane biogenesis